MGTWRRDTPEVRRALAEERGVLEATELVNCLLDERQVSRNELSKRLGISRSEVTQRLSGKRNLSVKTLAAMLHELGYKLRLGCDDLVATQPRGRAFHIGAAPASWSEEVSARYTSTGARLSAVREHSSIPA